MVTTAMPCSPYVVVSYVGEPWARHFDVIASPAWCLAHPAADRDDRGTAVMRLGEDRGEGTRIRPAETGRGPSVCRARWTPEIASNGAFPGAGPRPACQFAARVPVRRRLGGART